MVGTRIFVYFNEEAFQLFKVIQGR